MLAAFGDIHNGEIQYHSVRYASDDPIDFTCRKLIEMFINHMFVVKIADVNVMINFKRGMVIVTYIFYLFFYFVNFQYNLCV